MAQDPTSPRGEEALFGPRQTADELRARVFGTEPVGPTAPVSTGVAVLDDALNVDLLADSPLWRDVDASTPPTAGQTALSSVEGIARGLGDFGATMLQAPSALVRSSAGLMGIEQAREPNKIDIGFHAGKWLREAIDGLAPGVPEVERYNPDTWLRELQKFSSTGGSEALGSAAGFFAGGWIGRALGIGAELTASTLGASQQFTQSYQDAVDHGADGPTAWAAAMVGAGAGLTEGWGVGGIADRVNKASGGALLKAIKEVGKETLSEAGQEALQQAITDGAAKVLYDKDRDVLSNVAQGGAGGAFAGMVLSLLGVGMEHGAQARRGAELRRGIVKAVGDRAAARAAQSAADSMSPTSSMEASVGGETVRTNRQEPEEPGANAGPNDPMEPVRSMLDVSVSAGRITPTEARAAQLVEPETGEEEAMVEATRARGVQVDILDAGRPLATAAAYQDGRIVIDRRAEGGVRRFAVLAHEWGHALEELDGRTWQELDDYFQRETPDLYRTARAQSAAQFRAATAREPSAKRLASEAVSGSIEGVGGWLRFTYQNPEVAVRVAYRHPGLFARGVIALAKTFNRMFRTNLRTQSMKDLDLVSRELEKWLPRTETETVGKSLPASLALRAALKTKEALDSLLGTPVRVENLPKGRIYDDEALRGHVPAPDAGARTGASERAPEERSPGQPPLGDRGAVQDARDGDRDGSPREGTAPEGTAREDRPRRKRREPRARDGGERARGPVQSERAEGEPAREVPARGSSPDELAAIFEQEVAKAFDKGTTSSSEPVNPAPSPAPESHSSRAGEGEQGPAPAAAVKPETAPAAQEATKQPAPEPSPVVKWRKARIIPTREGIKTQAVDEEGNATEHPTLERDSYHEEQILRNVTNYSTAYRDAVRGKRPQTQQQAILDNLRAWALQAEQAPDVLEQVKGLVSKVGIDFEKLVRPFGETEEGAGPRAEFLRKRIKTLETNLIGWDKAIADASDGDARGRALRLKQRAETDLAEARSDLAKVEQAQQPWKAPEDTEEQRARRLGMTVEEYRKSGGEPTSGRHRDDIETTSPPRSALDKAGDDIEALFAFAWHGSGFAFDRFDSSFRGNGEGNAAFGVGHYLTDTREIAEHYRKQAVLLHVLRKAQEVYDVGDDPGEAEKLFMELEFPPSIRRMLEALKADDWLGWDYPHSAVSAVLSGYLDRYDVSPETVAAIENAGTTYHVEVPVSDDEWLYWDRGLDEQPKLVQDAIKTLVGDSFVMPTTRGASLYFKIAALRGDPRTIAGQRAASDALLAAGVRGIKYLDQTSRKGKKAESSFNYVVFSDKDIEIRARFALAPEAFDEEKYKKVRPAFEVVAEHLGKDAQDAAQLMRAIIGWLRDTRGMNEERVRNVAPYVIRFAQEKLGAAKTEAAPPAKKARAKKAVESTPDASPRNYVITPEDEIGKGGPKQKARQNIEAIRILKTLEREQRAATQEEKRALVKYVGWGASELAQNIFPPRGVPKPEWQELHDELRTLLSQKEIDAAARSTMNAHYTSEEVVRAIYKGVERLGFRGGRVLEPGMGIGHFVGMMPADLAENVRYTGVELDPTTAAIAKALYPRADVRSQGFEDFQAPKEFFDLAIGNPPFADVTILKDPEYRDQKLALHDFFFVKALDRVKPGGALVFITSRYTMDKQSSAVRDRLAEQADLLGAIRLPQTAFKENAGTEVVTDILFLRKRVAGEKPLRSAQEWQKVATVQTPEGPATVNQFFAENPEWVLGTHSLRGSMYGKNEYTLLPLEGAIGEQVRSAVDRLPKNVVRQDTRADGKTKDSGPEPEPIPSPSELKDGAYYLERGKVMVSERGKGTEVPSRKPGTKGGMSKPDLERIRSYIPLRDALRALVHAQTLGTEDLTQFQKNLETAYEAFVKKHGNIGAFTVTERETKDGEIEETRRYTNMSALKSDPDAYFVSALEEYDEEKRVFSKAAIFTQRTIRPAVEARIESASDALNVVLAKTGKVDLNEIARMVDKTPEATIEELGDRVYLNPQGDVWETEDAYLSGNVRVKLRAAEGAALAEPKFKRNVEALKKVIPADLPASKISVRLGAPWIPEDDVRAFSAEVLDLRARVSHAKDVGLWHYTANTSYLDTSAQTTWGTPRWPSDRLMEAILNNRSIVVTEKDSEGRQVVNAQETAAANEKAKLIEKRFADWLWEDPHRTERLIRKYNDEMNATVARKFNGEHLTTPGMSAAFSLRPHQKSAVWRIIQSGNTHLAHGVGAGKTLVMVTTAMELRRLGIAKKPLIVVPNHMLLQFAREALAAYPNARIMVADEEQFQGPKRKRFVGRVATGNWDMVIMTFSSFVRIPMGDRFLNDFDEELKQEYLAAAGIGGVDDSRSRKQIENKIASIEQRIAARSEQAKQIKDKGPTFEELGVDFMFVDEAHEFRKLDFATNQNRVKGIQPDGSAAARDAYTKVRYLERQNPGRSIVFASGTPITNTMAELFTLQKFMQLDRLKELGLSAFDGWARTFGESSSDVEKTAKGTYEIVTRFNRFRNLPELSALVREFMDVVRVSDIQGIRRPAIKGGGRQMVVAEPSPRMPELMSHLRSTFESASGPERGAAILQILTDGRFAAIDLRFSMNAAPGWKPDTQSDPTSKLNVLIDNVFRIYKEKTGATIETPKGPIKANLTQMVFSDLGAPDSADTRGFSAYQWIRSELIRRGVPSSEIAFIQDYKKADAKRSLFMAMNEGRVRVLLGSSKSMGTGVNAQRLLYALHHLDAPFLPSDMEQREGRAHRQGNLNPEIEVNAYATRDAYDETLWQILANKARFIEQFFLGDPELREMSDIASDSDSYAQARALTAGNPLIIEKVNLEADIDRLSLLARAHRDEKAKVARDLQWAQNQVQSYTRQQREVETFIQERGEVPEKAADLALDFGGESVSGDEIEKRLYAAASELQANAEVAKLDVVRARTIAKWNDLEVKVTSENRATKGYSWVPAFAWADRHGTRVAINTASAIGLRNGLSRAEEVLDTTKRELERWKKQVVDVEKIEIGGFKFADDLVKKEARLKQVEALLTNQENAAKKADLEGGTVYAFAPDDEDVRQVRKFFKKAARTGESTNIGSQPNPIANTDADENVRAFQRAAREQRWRRGYAQPTTIEQARTAGEAMDGPGVADELVRKALAGEAFDAAETHAMARLKNEAAREALRHPKGKRGIEAYRRGVLLNWAYQEARKTTAIALGTIRDALGPVAKFNEMLTEPTKAVREELNKAREERDQAKIDRLLEQEAKLLQRIREKLKEAGLDPDNLTDDVLNDPIVLGRAIRIASTTRSNAWDWVVEWRYAAMTGGPQTQVANATGNAAMALYNQHVRRLSEALVNLAVRSGDSASAQELVPFYRGFLSSFLPAAKNFVLSWHTELPVYDLQLERKGIDTQGWGQKLDGIRGPAIPGWVGRVVRAPSLRLLVAFDEFFKTIAGVSEAHALAWRAARAEGLRGDEAHARQLEILDDPSHPIHLESFKVAKVNAFQGKDGKLLRAVLLAREALNEGPGDVPVGTLLMPFVRTPAAIFKEGLSVPFHPLKALYSVPMAAARGQRARVVTDTASALMALGVIGAILHVLWRDEDEDLPSITGSTPHTAGPRGLANRTIPPYSIRFGDAWYSYRRIEPASVTIATIVDLANETTRLLRQGDGAAAVDSIGRMMGSIVDQAADKTFLRTFGDLYETIVQRDRGPMLPRLALDIVVLPMIPNVVRQPERLLDDEVRQNLVRKYEDKGLWTAAASALSYYAFPAAWNAPPPSYDLWGRPIRKGDFRSSSILRLLSPAPVSRDLEDVHRLDVLLLNYNDRVDFGDFGPEAKPFYPKPPDYWYTVGNRTLYWTNEEFAQLQRRAGELARERLQGRSLNVEQPTPRDVAQIEKVLQDARARARAELMRKRKAP